MVLKRSPSQTQDMPGDPQRLESAQTAGHHFVAREARFDLRSDIVIPTGTQLQIDECLARLRHHRTIYDEWNFRSVDPMALGAVMNFYGPPGTGKTMAAEGLAGTLGLPFLSLGCADLESRFLGETSKNIQVAFRAATQQRALLFFDEADTLLGKRLSSVTQGVDNEVNAMRSTMLIELERYEGLCVFATNFARNYDEAFRSRITYHVHFELPGLDERERLWRRMLVDGIPVEEGRESLARQCAEVSAGLSGRDIRTCMRLALPKAIMEHPEETARAQLRITHIAEAIESVKRAGRDVGTPLSAPGTRIGEPKASS